MIHFCLNITVGMFMDLVRFIRCLMHIPIASRDRSTHSLDEANKILSDAGCDLTICTVTNLHNKVLQHPVLDVFRLFNHWEAWPLSSFFACLSKDGHVLVYRWLKLFPIVKMVLKERKEGSYIIYDLNWGIGKGGFHSFLFHDEGEQSRVSIYTTFAPTKLFLEWMHDHVNEAIFRTAHKKLLVNNRSHT